MSPILDSVDVAPTTRAMIEECMRLIDESTNELRTISYLLHPPLLEELGLSRTLRGYVEGFSRRSGIAVSMTAQGELDRLGFDVELAVFRVVQESLSNVHRHSHSSTANIRLIRQGTFLTLEIADQGRGIPPGKGNAGVGIAGIRERVRLLKGTVTIRSDASGTLITISLPVPKEPAASSGAVA
jgi:signal transduction histidine kinase